MEVATKFCTKCSNDKPVNDFHVRRASKDGRQQWCKACQIKHVGKHREENHAAVLAREAISRVKWDSADPRRPRAHRLVQKAIKNGELVRQPCERCGEARVHAHHDNYDKPLEVRWLCILDHRERHRELAAAGIEP